MIAETAANINADVWIVLAVGGVLTPSVAWLVREVLSIRLKLVALETRLDKKDKDCERHQEWAKEHQASIGRIDRNVARLCQAMSLKETE